MLTIIIPYVIDQMPWLLFISAHDFMRLLFENSVVSRAASFQERHHFESGVYLRVASILQWHLFESGV